MTQKGYLILIHSYDCAICGNSIKGGIPYGMAVSVEGELQCPGCAHAKVMSGEIILMKKPKDSDEKEHREIQDKKPDSVLRDNKKITPGGFKSANEYNAKYGRKIPK